MRNTIAGRCAAALCLLLASCNLHEGFDKEEGQKVLAKAEFDRVFVDSSAELQVYASMNRMEEKQNPDAALEFGDGFKELYLMVMKEKVSDYVSMLEAAADNTRPDTSRLLATYGGNTTVDIIHKLGKGHDSLVAEKTLHGMEYRAYAITGRFKNVPLFYLKGVYRSPRYFYQVIAWTLASRRNLYEGVMQKMVESLQEEKESLQ